MSLVDYLKLHLVIGGVIALAFLYYGIRTGEYKQAHKGKLLLICIGMVLAGPLMILEAIREELLYGR